MINVDFEILEDGELVSGENLYEHTSYTIRFHRDLNQEEHEKIRLNYHSMMKKVSENKYRLRLANVVGRFPLLGSTYQVLSEKWDEDLLKQMWRDVSRRVRTLPFHHFAATSQPISRDSDLQNEEKIILYHQWAFLRDNLLYAQEIREAWEMIKKSPNQILCGEQRVNDSWRLVSVGEQVWQRMAEGHDLTLLPDGHSLGNTSLASRLNAGGRTKYPNRVYENVKQLQVDCTENRFLKNLLKQLLEITHNMERYLERCKASGQVLYRYEEINGDNKKLQELIGEMVEENWLQEVGEYTGLRSQSTVLQYQLGYREWFSFSQEMLREIQYPFDDQDMTHFIESRSVDKVYEYWCYFEVLRIIEEVTECSAERPREDELESGRGHHLKQGSSVKYEWKGEIIEVFLNKTFSRKKKDPYSKSFTREAEPDISILWRNTWYHFDAKYKNASEHKEFYNSEDLSVMHMYRDAIMNSCSAIALYPSRTPEKLLFLMPNREKMGCIGAIGLVPGTENAKLKQVIRTILKRGK